MMSELASPADPLVLADGTKVDPATGKVIREKRNTLEVPRGSEAQKQMMQVRRRLVDLPEVPEKMHAVGLVLMYELFGLPDQDIALACGITAQQVGVIKMADAYKTLSDEIVQSVIAQDADVIRNSFHANAMAAADRINEFIHSDSEGIALSASKDALDRAGFRPADVVEHRHNVAGGLTIEITHRNDDNELPIIDIDVAEVEDAHAS
ncbi:MAG: hypothetical protein QGG09_06795 [Pirellulaceae bacterium]|nr:hypothetical protein [Pirellulaceae bacterium]